MWNGHDARCRQVPAPSFAVTPEDLSYAPGTLLRDAAGRYWLVRDDGQTAAGTNGGVMVDLRRGDPVYRPDPCIAPPGNLCTDTGCWDADRCIVDQVIRPGTPGGDDRG